MKRVEIEALTGLRGVAALWVLQFHIHQTLQGRELWPQFARKLWHLAGAGFAGVDMFFVLSGFVLAYNYPAVTSTAEYGVFLHKRLARIYPVHIVMLAFVFVVWGSFYLLGLKAWPAAMYDPVDLLANLTLMHAWFGAPPLSWNIVSWSISAEWFAYLAFPLILMMAHSLKRPFALIAFVVLINLVWFAATQLIDGWSMPLLRVAVGFTSGVCVYRIWMADTGRRFAIVAGRLCIVTTVVMLVVGGSLENRSIGMEVGHSIYSPTILPALMPIIIWSLAYDHTLSRWLAKPIAKYLGYISYSFYLVHEVVILGLADLAEALQIGAKVSAVLLFTTAPVIAILLAMILYHRIEEPMRRRLTSPKRPPPVLAES